MRNASIVLLTFALAAPAVAAPPRPILPAAGAAWIPVGLQLRDGAPPEAAPAPTPAPAPAPNPAPAPPARSKATRSPPVAAAPGLAPAPTSLEPVARSPGDEAVDSAIRQRFGSGGVPPARVPDALTLGVPVSPSAQRALDAIARAAGIPPGQLAAVGNTPRDQARVLVEKLFEPSFGEARVRVQYGAAGALAATAYRRVRDVYQVLDLNPEQKDSVVDVVAAALITGGAVGQVDDPAVERVDVDPGPRADRRRFERAIAGSEAITRCLRPSRGDRFYALDLPRSGGGGGGATCSDPWSSAPALVAQPEIGDARTSSGAASDAGAPPTGGRDGSTVVVQPRDNPAPIAPSRDGSVQVTPVAPEGISGDPGAVKYIVTDGPKGPVVTVAPAR